MLGIGLFRRQATTRCVRWQASIAGVAVWSSLVLAQTHTIVHLEPFPDEAWSTGYAINNFGHVVGDWGPVGTSESRGFYYDGVKHDLGLDVHPRGISDNDLVTGYYSYGGSFRYDPSTGEFTSLGTLGGPTSVAVDVNNAGECVGRSDMTSGPYHAFLYTDGAMLDLGVPTGTGYATDYTKANGINESSLVIGEALVGYGGDYWAIPFVYNAADPNAVMLRLDGAYMSGSAWALNDLGHIVGWTSMYEDTWGDAFLYDGTVMTGLGSLPGTSYSIATAINNLDEVVGYSFGEWVWSDCCGWLWTNGIYHPFYYRDGVMVDVNSLIPAEPGGAVGVPVDINDSGKMLAPLGSEAVVVMPISTADGDADGSLTLADFGVFVGCFAGPQADPSPPPPMLGADCIRVFDLDSDYDVDLADVARFEQMYSHPGVVRGTVEYTGTAVGDIVVTAANTWPDGFSYTTIMPDAGAFEVIVWRTGDYALSAYLDANDNGSWDSDEPYAGDLTGPFHVLGEGGLVEDIFIDLGPYSVAGSVAYADGTPVSGVTITASGAMGASTVSQVDGAYLLTDLIRGAYVVTPTEATRYFYPFDAEVTLEGADLAGVTFEAHDLPTGEVDGESFGTITAVDLAHYSLTIDEGGQFVTLFVYADTRFTGAADSFEQVAVGYLVEAQYYSSVNLAVQIDTNVP